MNQEWLENYSQEEHEQYRRFLIDWSRGKRPPEVVYPAPKRFPKLRSPTSELFPQHVWAQIPLYGSSFLGLYPLPKRNFLEFYGMKDLSELDHLQDLAKDTGRVQFFLLADPSDFGGCDFLEPLLTELKPPFQGRLPADFYLKDMEEWKYSREEFLTLAPLKMVPFMSAAMGYGGGYATPWILHEVGNFAASYATLKSLGYLEVSEKILELLLDDVRSAFGVLGLFQDLIVKPGNTLVRFCYNGTTNLDHGALAIMAEDTKKQGIQVGKLPATMPYEIGKFLVSKLSLLPEGYHSCVSLIDTYTQFDIQKLVGSIQEGVSSKNIDEMKSTSSELSQAFDSVWKDAKKLTSRQRDIKLAFTVSLGVIGGLATLPEFGIGGILASLGFQIAEQSFADPISMRLARKMLPDYVVGIHNFKEKYAIPD